MKELKFVCPGEETLVHIITNDFGNGMMFKYDLTKKNHCYFMSVIGEPSAAEVRELIKKYDNNK